MNQGYTVGAAKVDVTPPLCVPYLGFAPHRHSFFTAVHDPLAARVAFLTDGGQEALVVAAEFIGFSDTALGPGRSLIAELRQHLSAASGVPPEHIMISAAHVHSSPELLNFRPLIEHPGVPEWLEQMMNDLAEAARRARQQAFPASLSIGRRPLFDISRNRRGEACLDDELTVLLFRGEDGRCLVLANFAAHPVIVQAQPLVSADFVGVAQATVEQALGAGSACLFLQGACGDLNPIGYNRDLFPDLFQGVRFTGLALAGGILATAAALPISSPTLEPVALRVASTTLDLPSRPLPDEQEQQALAAQAAAGAAGPGETMARVAEGPGPFAAEIQALALGGAVLVGIPGEPFCRLGMAIKQLAAPLVGVPVGYANGYLGYLAPPEAWEKGGYEVNCGPWSKIGPEGFGLILKAIPEVLSRVSAS